MRLLYLSILSFLLIASTTLSFSKLPKTSEEIIVKDSEVVKGATKSIPYPVFKPQSQFPNISAQAALIVDLDTEVILYEKNPDELFLPASTTKIITALVALDYFNLNQVLTVGDLSVDGQRMNLVTGEQIMVSDLLYGLLIFSANDASEVLASNFPGGRESFVTAMNLKAKEIGLNNTYFDNPSGLDGDSQLTTARDLVKAASHAMENDFFRKAVATKEITVESTDEKFIHKLLNINELIGEVDGVLGVKTGWTENAQENLVTYIEREGRRIMIAILASEDRFGETKQLIEWVFENYEWKNITYPKF